MAWPAGWSRPADPAPGFRPVASTAGMRRLWHDGYQPCPDLEVDMKRWRWAGAGMAVVLAVPLTACADAGAEQVDAAPAPAAAAAQVEQLTVEVLERYPHDTAAFTQGLELHDGLLYEGTGLEGQSDMRIVDPETGEVLQSVDLPADVFGEGITVVGDRIWQITWQEQIAYLRDRETLAELDQFTYTGEGWGICYDEANDRLIMSNGTADLTFRDPTTFEPTGTVTVTRDGQPLVRINELECVGNRVLANVWLTDEIVRIDPATGTVEAVVNAAGLLTPEEAAGADVLNGIAATPSLSTSAGTGTFMITGKLWPWLFLVRFVPAS
jgi:glutamine cyclotransferase